MSAPRRSPEHGSLRCLGPQGNITELHPEELFDKRAQNQLSRDEERVLEEHLERCAACRAEREAREHFQQALTVDHGALELALGGALGRIAEERARAPESASPPAPSKPPVRRPTGSHRKRGGAVLAGVLLIAGAAAALGSVGDWRQAESDVEPAGLIVTASTTKTPLPKRKRAEPSVLGTALGTGGLAVATPESPAVPALIAAGQSSGAGPKRAASSLPVRPVPVGAPSAGALFRKANAARSQGRLERAEALYGELIQRYPQARESEAARALLAQLAMDHGSPQQALSAYDAYMRHGDEPPALREEALVGRARALQAMSDAQRERQAWLELLRRFPKSAAAGEARQRLRALSDP
ncbi:MAG: tol-pal system YbgF family protein [Polyangiaceae bacterium]